MAFPSDFATVLALDAELARLRAVGGLPFAEAALTLMLLERFLRILPGVNASDRETLPQLLQRACDRKLLAVAGGEPHAAIDRVRRFRNATLHANHEQAAKRARAGVGDYLAEGFAEELDFVAQLTRDFMSQIEPETGRKKP